MLRDRAAEELVRRLQIAFSDMDFVDNYSDNFSGDSNSLDDILSQFTQLLRRCLQLGIKLNLGDTEIGNKVGKVVGFEAQLGGYSPGARMQRGVSSMRPPQDQRELKSLLASANVMRRRIANFNLLVSPFSHLLKKDAPFEWTAGHTQAFHALCARMCSPKVLRPFDPALPTRIYTDYNGALGLRRPALGAALWQCHKGVWYPVGYASRYLSVAEERLILKESAYSSSIGECLAFAFAMRYFYPELSQLSSWVVLVDARNLTYWRSSASPLMVNLRAAISGLYDLSRVNLMHISRTKQFEQVCF